MSKGRKIQEEFSYFKYFSLFLTRQVSSYIKKGYPQPTESQLFVFNFQKICMFLRTGVIFCEKLSTNLINTN